MPRFRNLLGDICNNLWVIGYAGKSGANHNHSWWTVCLRCGRSLDHPVITANIVRNHTTSCGCVQAEVTAQRNLIHGESKRGAISKEFWAVQNAIQRCENPANPRYNLYGQAGRIVCLGVRNVENLLALIGRCPPGKISLGRIDNQGSYTCGVCPECVENGWVMNLRWENHKEQMNNTISSVRIEGKTISELATTQGKPISQVRIEHGLKNWG